MFMPDRTVWVVTVMSWVGESRGIYFGLRDAPLIVLAEAYRQASKSWAAPADLAIPRRH
jgi:hypothetical protein